MILPNVVIAGAPKCGTTSVFEWLSRHPEVCVSSRKETGFFLDRQLPAGPLPHADLAAYGRFFAHCGRRPAAKVVLEATPDYFDAQTAIAAVPALPTAPQIVILLRRPSRRIYSAFQFARNNLSTLPKRLSFTQFVAQARAGGSGPAADTARLAFEQTRYARHVARWYAAAGRERVCILLLEHLRADQAGFMRRLSARLGLDAGFWDDFDFAKINAGYRVKSQTLHRLVRRLTAAAPSLVYHERLKRCYGALNKTRSAGIAADEAAVLAQLDEQFRDDNRALAALAGLDLSCWEAPRADRPGARS
jgi:hypothetical protein